MIANSADPDVMLFSVLADIPCLGYLASLLTLYAGNLFMIFFFCGYFFFKINFSKNSFKNAISVKLFGSRSGPVLCLA